MIHVTQELHALLEVSGQEVLRKVHALKLLHGLKLLFALHASIVECLVLSLDALYFPLYFLLPVAIFNLTAFVIFEFEFSNLFKLMFFLDFQGSLLNRLHKQHIQDWLNFYIIVEKIMVLNLCDLVDTSLLGNIFWSWWFRLENISLQFHFCLVRFDLALLGKEVSEINFNSCWGTWSQIIRTGSILRLFEFHQLRFNHFDLLLLPFFFNSLLLFLGWRYVLLEYIDIMSVSSENSLIVHYIKSSAAFIFFWNSWIKHAVLGSTIFVFSSNNLGLGSFKTL